MKKKLQLFRADKLFLIVILMSCNQLFAQNSWNTVRVGGGGQTTSIQAHPLVKDLYFITTDVGTPYRWNSDSESWEGLFYSLPSVYWKKNAGGNIAFDPSDNSGNVLYATIGGPYSDGALLKSTDRGTTWIDCELALDVKPNNDQKNGQRLSVDPNNSKIIYVTTRSSAGTTDINGTFRSTNAGEAGSWEKINDLYGSFLLFDGSQGTISDMTKNIYIGCKEGVYQSTDGGESFELMTGSPENSRRAEIHKDGTLYVTHATGVAKWDNENWTDISPTEDSYRAVGVNPNNSSQVIVGINSWSSYKYSQYLSNDGGASWTKISPVKDNTEVPWYAKGIGEGLDDFCWDPYDENMVWFTDFFNAHQTTDIWAGNSITWKARAIGHEETVTIGNLLCPPSGENILLSNVADIGGWDHKSLSESPEVGMMSFFPWSFSGDAGNMTGVAIQETNPDFIARVGRHGWNGSGYAGYSTDGGASYTLWDCPSDAAGGRIAVSATSEKMVWATQSGPCYYSTDRGETWTKISTLPEEVIAGGSNVFNSGHTYPLAADKVNGNKFYVYKAGIFYVSTDGGASFTEAGSLPEAWYSNPLMLETTPGKEGDIWISMYENGLYHSTNSGSTFTKIDNIQVAYYVSCGKAISETSTYPAIYVFGTVNNIENGLFRSNDNGETWEVLNSPIQTGYKPDHMVADRRTYGRVYFGTHGNGLFYVDNTDATDIVAPSAPTGLRSSNLSNQSFTLHWNHATDNVGVLSYEIFMDDVSIGTTTSTSMDISGLSDSTEYSMSVKTLDVSGNWSEFSESFMVTTYGDSFPRFTNIVITPDTVTLDAGTSLTFTAQGYDQYGDSIETSFLWTVSEGASISSTGIFFSINEGTYTVTASSDNISGTAQVNVIGSLDELPVPGVIYAGDYSDMYGLTVNDHIGYVDVGDWIEYNVNIKATGLYSITFHAASAYSSGACDIKLDDGDVLGTFSCPGTGGWTTYADFTINVRFTEGIHTLGLDFTGGGFNIEYMVLTKIIETMPIPGIIQAGNYTEMSGLTISDYIGDADAGDWIEFKVDVNSAGSYITTFHAASAYNTGSCDISVDGGETLGTFKCTGTGDLNTYDDFLITIELPEGEHNLRLDYIEGGFNIEYIEFEEYSSVEGISDNTFNEDVIIFYSAVSGTLNLEKIEDYDKARLYNLSGQLVYQVNTNNLESLSINVNSFNRGMYIVQLSNSSAIKTRKYFKY